MRGESAKARPFGYRRLAVAGTGMGAVAIAAVFALSSVASAGIAHPGTSFPGAYWSPSTFRLNGGCAQAHAYPAHWTAKTGHGAWHGSDSAKTCPAYRGGLSAVSQAEVSSQLTVYAPVTMPSGTGGINVSWDLKAAISVAGGLVNSTNLACPVAQYNYSYNFGYTWYNFTEIFGNCEAGANAELYGFAYLYDMTTKTYSYPSNYWNGFFNDSGAENLTEWYSATYSNSSYWAYNYSFAYNVSGTFGSSGGFNGVLDPQWFINGTFVSTDSYQVITYIGTYSVALAFGFSSPAHGAASINMGGLHDHEDLMPFSIW